jgi:hypothetical protein
VGSFADREQIAAAAKSAADAADQILQQVRRQQYDAALTTRVMQEIAGDGNSIAEQGERAAEQAAMALDSLSIAYQKNEKIANQPELSAAIDRLFQQFNNPSAYNAPVFAAEMQKLKVLLPHGIQTADSRP